MGDNAAPFIAESHATVSGHNATVSFTGCRAGDLGVLIACDSATAAPSGWTSAGANVSWSGNTTAVFYKVLTSADITAGSITLNGAIAGGGVVFFAAYRNVTTATIVSGAETVSATTLDIPGFTRSASSRVIIGYCFAAGSGALTPPARMASRVSSYAAPSSFLSGWADFLPARSYADGAPLRWSWTTASAAQVQAIELA